jgi:hypothetical protein
MAHSVVWLLVNHSERRKKVKMFSNRVSKTLPLPKREYVVTLVIYNCVMKKGCSYQGELILVGHLARMDNVSYSRLAIAMGKGLLCS